MENVDDERRQIFEEAIKFDHIWGVWEEEKEKSALLLPLQKRALR